MRCICVINIISHCYIITAVAHTFTHISTPIIVAIYSVFGVGVGSCLISLLILSLSTGYDSSIDFSWLFEERKI